MGLDQVLADLESEGYSTRTFVVPACGVNAPHKRDRLWIVGYAEHDGSSTSKIRGSNAEDARGASQGQIQTKQSSGASGREHDVTLADTNSDDGRNGSSTKSQGRQSRMEHRSGSQRQPIQEPNKNVADTTILGSQEHGHGKSDEFVHVSEDVADTNNARQSSSSRGGQNNRNEEGHDIGRSGENVANSSGEGSQGRLSGRSNSERQSFVGQSGCSSSTYGQSGEDWWAVEPNVRRVAHGIPKRVDRIKGLGNAIVPQIAMNIGLAIKEQL
jgi:DNA (cytosine-5)-methyltransferase 1